MTSENKPITIGDCADPVQAVKELFERGTPDEQDKLRDVILSIANDLQPELIEIRCHTCNRAIGPTDPGVWLNELPICEECAQEVWRMMQEGRGSGRTI